MDLARRFLLLAVLAVFGCGPVAPSSPPVTRPLQTPATSGSTSDEPSSAIADIAGLVAAMEAAVDAGSPTSYLQLVHFPDPVFKTEHIRWVEDWSGPNPLAEYALQIADLVVGGQIGTGQLTVTWTLQFERESRTATFPVRFTRGLDGWRYAGENWIATEVPQFVIRAAPGLEDAVPPIVMDLPRIYERVTAALDHVPAGSMEIKVYADPSDLVANTLLSLPNILGWNEPGEALKLQVEPYQPLDPDVPVLSPVIAHEFSHFIGFDRAGTQRSRMPWWLDEGVASYVASDFEGATGPDRLQQVVAWAAAGGLADWDSMTVFEETPRDLWQFVYPQGYAMVRYVTEEHGDEARNAWLAAMATEMDIDQATPAAFEITFDQLDAGFRDWLATQG